MESEVLERMDGLSIEEAMEIILALHSQVGNILKFYTGGPEENLYHGYFLLDDDRIGIHHSNCRCPSSNYPIKTKLRKAISMLPLFKSGLPIEEEEVSVNPFGNPLAINTSSFSICLMASTRVN